MTIIGNKRTTQLVPITPAEVVSNDLFYIIDISAHESKKMTASDLALYLNSSGSLFAIHAINSDTASFVLPGGITFTVPSASFASFVSSASFASFAAVALSASNSITASFSLNGEIGNAQSASYLIYTGAINGTASFSLTSSFTRNTQSSSFLIFNGSNNGTASFALTTQNVNHAVNADTASYLNASLGLVASASHANVADNAAQSQTASFLQYNGVFNGTASFALNAAIANSRMIDYGIFLATTQSNYNSQIDTLLINPSSAGSFQTDVEAIGSATLYFTSSVITNDSISLSITDKFSGTPQVIDSIPVFWNTTAIMDNWNTFLTGSMSIPFLLIAQINLTGSYLVQVNSTPNVILNSSRITRFSVASTSDGLSAGPDAPIDFAYTPAASYATFFSASIGPFTDTLPGILTTGSAVLTSINLSSAVVISSIRYTWKCVSLQSLNCANNPFLTTLNYKFPSSLNTLICNNCNLGFIYNISNTSMSYFDCSNNLLSSVTDMPQTQNYTMSYFNCSNNSIVNLPLLAPSMSIISCSTNPLTSIPTNMPSGLKEMDCNSTQLNVVTSVFPNTAVSLSFQNNLLLQSWFASFPISLVSWKASNSPLGIGGFPTPSVSMSSIQLNNCSLNILGASNSMDFVFSASLINAASHSLFSGSIDVRGNGVPDVSTFNNYIIPLTGSAFGGKYNWTLLYD
jgi:hypothetical protein